MNHIRTLALVALSTLPCSAADPWVVYEGREGVGKGKHIVLISGDEEYRSEEALPQLGKILATHHGFKCTVLFAIDPATGVINPNVNNNIPGLEALKSADLMVIFTRFRNLPSDQMKHIDDYLSAGKPVVGLRTATHAFSNAGNKDFARYHWQSKDPVWKEGFGRYVLGETWVAHHGGHGSQATRGILAKDKANHPILKGIKDGDIFGPTDVYTVRLPLPADCTPLVFGQVVEGMKFDDPPSERNVGKSKAKLNDPMMPVAWTKSYTVGGETGRVFTTTMGSSQDFAHEGTRRLVVNACLWAVGLEERIPEKTKVDIVGEYNPTPFRSVKEWKGTKKPGDLAR
ncbi:MAG TPA: ThuA domain-containing protein [Gemmataceae bacterium]|nr:ThuA domain-containing protein [Gemmataceae bacterium]